MRYARLMRCWFQWMGDGDVCGRLHADARRAPALLQQRDRGVAHLKGFATLDFNDARRCHGRYNFVWLVMSKRVLRRMSAVTGSPK